MNPQASNYTLAAFLIYFGILGILLLSLELSFRLGRYKSKTTIKENDSLLQMIQAGSLTMIALLLAFGVSIAEVRFEGRLQNLSEEGNGFSTTALLARLLPVSVQKQFLDELTRNLRARILFYNSPGTDEAQKPIEEECKAAQKAMWKIITDTAAKHSTSTALPVLIKNLTETFDIQEKQGLAYKYHVPRSITWLLLFASIFIVAGMGYICGLHRRRDFVYTNLLTLLIATTLFVIIDLDRPRGGMIQIHPYNLIEHLENLTKADKVKSTQERSPSPTQPAKAQ